MLILAHNNPTQQPAKILNSETLAQLRELLGYLPRKRLHGLLLLLLISIAVGLFDFIFIALVARLVGSISGARLQDKIPQVLVFGGDAVDQGIWIAALVIVLVWISMSLKFAATLIQSILSAKIWADLGNRIYKNLLMQSYEYFQNQNTSHLLAKLNRILSRVSDQVILPLLTIVGNSLSITILMVGVIYAFGLRALILFVSLFVAYAIASDLITPHLRFAAKQKLRFSTSINTLLTESSRSIRDVQLYNAENFYLSKFKTIGAVGKKYDRISILLPDLPRYVIEPIGISLLFLIGLLPALLSNNPERAIKDAVPLLVGVMFAAQRLSGPIQTSFKALNKLRGGLPDIVDALTLLQLTPQRHLLGRPGVPSASGIMPRHAIGLHQVSFRYAESHDWVLRDVNLTVPIGSRVALVGATGGGKTTAAHLLLGLLQPQRGELQLDGLGVTREEMPAWQACCAMVPQNIMLLDTSIRCNVAFGAAEEGIDNDAVWDCLKLAQLDDYVSELPYGIYTIIGEDGAHLSGGQRQRLALARAFYKRAEVLILDEATSALDNKTENDLMASLELIGRRCTTIVIAHRLSTIRYCDRIYEFRKGEVVASGSYDELITASPSFRELVTLQHG